MTVARRALVLTVLITSLATLAACGGKKVERIDTDTTIDLSGRWNDADSRMVGEEVVADVLTAPWIVRFEGSSRERPTVIVGNVKNRSDEFIAVETFTKDVERAFVNSGRVRVVASSSEREQLRDERSDQADFSSPETVKQFGREYGADYMMMGTINKITDQEGKQRVVYYQVDLELTSIETNEKVWIGGKKHKKLVTR
jgi:penicillin-binding protein activator